MSRFKQKDVFEHAQNAQIHPAQAQSLIQVFVLYRYLV